MMNKELRKLDKKITKNKLSAEAKQKQKADKMAILNPQKVNIFNIWKKYPKKVMWMLLSSFLYNIGLTIFLKKAATIASGTSSLSQIITFTAPATAQFFGLFYVLVNLPLMFAFWKLNPRMFMVLTYYWMFFQIIVQLIFIEYNGRGSNPIVNFINQKISFYNPIGQTNYYWDPFGFDTRVLTKLQNEDPNNISNILNVAMGNEVEGLSQSGKEIAIYLQNQFGGNDLKNIVDNIGDIQQSTGIKNINLNNLIPQILNGKNQTKIYGIYDGQNWPVIFYAILGALTEGFASIIAWRQRGSIGGSSVISNYIAYKNKKPVGNAFLLVSICFSAFSTIVVGSLEYTRNITGHVWDGNLFLVRILGTIAYLLVFTILVNKFYPKYKKVKIEIYSKYPELIAEQFKKINYVHPFNIFNGVGGFSHNEFGKIETVALFFERDIILEQVKKVDKSAWITISSIHGISGQFDTSFVD
ncbi:Hypothetical protein, putative transmembrane protein [Metamycoplasma alkalescens 14918]|uniref:DUF2179 domain-containing protein n=3 Tax=Metamycoplasma alkalescens TaxID=45363 RepID=N9UAK2_9BACT|nr:DUF2179 domain-containing protein [Metamycoplasma alkalescens]ENY53716.1 Hypothetical protein, putative transmembrane protein [Metamycoplasma alkalescens 14918]